MNNPEHNNIKRALISVSDKSGIVAFGKQLCQLGIEIISTGGTAKLLQENAIEVIEVSDYTGFPEMMDGRLKTLHPKIHGGLLGRRGIDDQSMLAQDIKPIDLLVVNLYPFESTIANPHCTLDEAIENIDIGGPTLLRAAAKNYQDITVIVNHEDYAPVLEELQKQNSVSLATKKRLSCKVFQMTAKYDGMISNYLSSLDADNQRTQFPKVLNLQFMQKQPMRYGENPHQKGAFYGEEKQQKASISGAVQIQGKALSYNNVVDSDAALQCVKAFPEQPTCVIVKHANPCGVALAEDCLQAYQKAYATDPTSAFGGIIAFNRALDAPTANAIIAQQFVEVIIAPEITEQAKSILASKKNIRVLICGELSNSDYGFDFKRVSNGLLVQESDQGKISANDVKTVTSLTPDAEMMADLLFAWRVVKFVKSNAIIFCKAGQTIGIGAGQMSRVSSSQIAVMKAQEAGFNVKGSVMASDAFFPFRDGLDIAAKEGISGVIQPGGSMRDAEVITAANEANMVMVFSNMRHFRH